MSGITLTQAQQILDALIAAQISDPAGAIGSVSIAGRSVTYRSAQDLIDLINFWERKVSQLTRASRGRVGPRHLLPNFRGCR